MPLAPAPRAGPHDGLAGHVDLQLSGVEHLDAENVVLPAVACPERLGHGRDAEAEQPPARPRFLLLLTEVVVVDRLRPDVEALAVLTGVQQETERRPVRELVVPHEVHPPEPGLVHPQVRGGGLHHPLLEEHRLGDPERAAVGNPAGRLIAIGTAGGEMGDGTS